MLSVPKYSSIGQQIKANVLVSIVFFIVFLLYSRKEHIRLHLLKMGSILRVRCFHPTFILIDLFKSVWMKWKWSKTSVFKVKIPHFILARTVILKFFAPFHFHGLQCRCSLSIAFMAIIRMCSLHWKMWFNAQLCCCCFCWSSSMALWWCTSFSLYNQRYFFGLCLRWRRRWLLLLWLSGQWCCCCYSTPNRFCVVWQSGKCSSSYSGYEWFSDWNEKTESSAETTKRCKPTLLT